MKKKYLFVSGAKRWNNLLAKFTKLQKKLQLLTTTDSQYSRLVSRLKQIFSKLEKMQYQTGIKIASTSLAIMLTSFTAQAQFAAGVQVYNDRSIEAYGQLFTSFTDLDADGDNDMYVGLTNGTIQGFLNTNGVYTQINILPANSVAIDVGSKAAPVFGDVDADGDIDLYVGNQQGTIEVFTNNGGAFYSAGSLQVDGVAVDFGSHSAPAFADIDGDGDLDLYVGYNSLEGNGEIQLFTNNNGTFTPAGVMPLTGPPPNVSFGLRPTPAFNDADNDGDLDLYAGSSFGWITLFTNNNGIFTFTERIEENSVTINLNPGDSSHPAFNDADGDGDNDLYLNVSTVYTNNEGAWANPKTLRIREILDVGSRANPAFADIDGDGNSELYVGNSNTRINVFNKANGVFEEAAALQQSGGTTLHTQGYSAPTFEDLDDDGDLDLYIGERYGDVSTFINDNGAFTAASNLINGESGYADNYVSPAFADIDGDGDLDLYAGQYYGAIEVFTNNDGDFASAGNLQADGVEINLNYDPSPIFTDIDNDGDLDLCAGVYTGEVHTFTNTDGVFTAGPALQAAGVNINVGSYAAPAFVDIDNDGDLDLYVGNSLGNITFYENTSSAVVLVNAIEIQGVGNVSAITTLGGTLQMEAMVLPVNADDATYFWSVVNQTGMASIDENGLLTAIADGTVSVRATANDGSGITGVATITISNQSVGVNEIETNNISIYPNPVSSQLFIDLEDRQVEQLEIIDYTGRAVKIITDVNVQSIDISDLKLGAYTLKVSTENGVSINQFVKQ